jgi:hypothetical protein
MITDSPTEREMSLQERIVSNPNVILLMLKYPKLKLMGDKENEIIELIKRIDETPFIVDCSNCGKVADYVTFGDRDCWIQPWCIECDIGSKMNKEKVTVIRSYYEALLAVVEDEKINEVILRQYIVLKGLRWHYGF